MKDRALILTYSLTTEIVSSIAIVSSSSIYRYIIIYIYIQLYIAHKHTDKYNVLHNVIFVCEISDDDDDDEERGKKMMIAIATIYKRVQSDWLMGLKCCNAAVITQQQQYRATIEQQWHHHHHQPHQNQNHLIQALFQFNSCSFFYGCELKNFIFYIHSFLI